VQQAHISPENIAAKTPYRLGLAHAGNTLRRSVENCDTPILVNRKNALVDGIKYCNLSACRITLLAHCNMLQPVVYTITMHNATNTLMLPIKMHDCLVVAGNANDL
jgi:hypothetical protein